MTRHEQAAVAVAAWAARLVARGDDEAPVLRAAVDQTIIRVSAKEVSKNGF